MYRLSSIALILFGLVQVHAQSPHGDDFKVDCAACHVSSAWLPLKDSMNFDHATTTFLLEGRHEQIECKQCHKSNVFSAAPTQCVNCHTDMHNMSVGTDCARCHSTETWIVDIIPELHERSGFPLVGAHNTPNCASCHVSETSLRFNPIGNDCINCHRTDYLSTANPNHQEAGYSTNCIECHEPFSPQWNAEFVNHDFFPLEQGHDNLGCARCHVTGNYSDASPECVSCHQTNYNATTNPNHQNAGFSTECTQCHTIAGWTPSLFDHDAIYPLLDAHKEVEHNCNLCHAQGYSNTPNTCAGCHMLDFNNTTNPNHVDAQFSNDCALCHTQVSWRPSTFDHDGMYFPIYSGKHRGKWNSCTECHTSAGNYSTFSCIQCHEHSNQAEVNNKHKDVNGYSYNSNACFTCHPTGDE